MENVKQKVLCVCKGNTCTSPIMEALFNKGFRSFGIKIAAESAGTMAQEGSIVSKYSVVALAEMATDAAIELSKHRPRSIRNLHLSEYAKIYCVDAEVYDAVIEQGGKEGQTIIFNGKKGGIPNPHTKELGDYQDCAHIIKNEVDNIVNLCAQFYT